MMASTFNKGRAMRFLNCLDTGEPLKCMDPSGWSPAEAIEAAGACLYFLITHWPEIRALSAKGHGKTWEFPQNKEHAEAQAMDVRRNSELAINAAVGLLAAAVANKYDGVYEETISLLLNANEEPEKQVQILRGLKQTPDQDQPDPSQVNPSQIAQPTDENNHDAK